MSTLPYLIAAGAVAAPMLLVEAASAGAPVPIHIEPGHAAALAELHRPLSFDAQGAGTVTMQMRASDAYARASAAGWLSDLVQQLGPMRPGSPKGPAGYILTKFAATVEDCDALAARFMSAVRAGAGAGYQLVPYRIDFDGAVGTREDQVNVASNIASGDYSTRGGKFTSLGSALVTLAKARAKLYSFATEETTATVHVPACVRALVELANAMDDVGMSVVGAPPAGPSIFDGVSHAAGATVAWLLDTPARFAVGAAGSLASALLSTPGLLLVGGFVVYRTVRK